MRVAFTAAVEKALLSDPDSLLITGDLGYNAFEGLASRLGPRFLNAGVAEQNMMGVAAGTALAGFRPWVYSIAPFATLRCLEQIRNDICLHDLPVRIVGNGGGYTYGVMGSTHHALEDLACLKALPNMTLYFPCADDQVKAAVVMISGEKGPTYLRLAISGFPSSRPPLAENPATLTRTYHLGGGATIVAVGHAVQIALSALETSDSPLQDADVFGLAKFPFDLKSDSSLLKSVEKTQRVVVVEEHYQNGGVGESLKAALPGVERFDILGAKYFRAQRYGGAAFHLKQSGLSPEDLAERVRSALR